MLTPIHQVNYTLKISNKTIRYLLYVLLFIISPVGCKNKDNKSNISQGLVLYDINYINQSGKKFPIQLMPKTMELLFNKEFSSYTIEDRLGLFSIKNILTYKESKHITIIKVFDKKYVYVGLPKEKPILFDASVDYQVKYKDDTSRYAGFLCSKAIITDKNSKDNFNVYYTHHINIDHPNKNTPYEAIDGMLLSFRLHLKSLDMQLNAKEFVHKIVDNKEFETPKGYKQISRKQMEEIITTILP